MDKSSKAVDEALARVREEKAALTATKRLTNDRLAAVFEVMGAGRGLSRGAAGGESPARRVYGVPASLQAG